VEIVVPLKVVGCLAWSQNGANEDVFVCLFSGIKATSVRIAGFDTSRIRRGQIQDEMVLRKGTTMGGEGGGRREEGGGRSEILGIVAGEVRW
jgi:hypothetical protein